MNKALFILAIIITIITLSACSGSTKSNNATSTDSQTEQQSTTTVSSENDNSITQNDTVVVPNVVGMNVDEAKAKLEDLGLKVETEPFYREREKKDGEYILVDDRKVLEQIDNGETIILHYNTLENRFDYTENIDGTIILGRCRSYSDNQEFIIPKTYKNKTVNELSNELVNQINTEINTNIPLIKIPQNLKINGEFKIKNIIYY